MGQLISSGRPFRGAYEQLANDEDEFLETRAESCAFSTAENESLRREEGDVADVTAPHGRNCDALESQSGQSGGPLSSVTTNGQRESNRPGVISSADEKAGGRELGAASGSGTLVKVTECTDCGNNCTETVSRQRLPSEHEQA